MDDFRLNPFDLDWQGHCINQPNLFDLIADGVLTRDTARGQPHSIDALTRESCVEQNLSHSLDDSAGSLTQHPYPALTPYNASRTEEYIAPGTLIALNTDSEEDCPVADIPSPGGLRYCRGGPLPDRSLNITPGSELKADGRCRMEVLATPCCPQGYNRVINQETSCNGRCAANIPNLKSSYKESDHKDIAPPKSPPCVSNTESSSMQKKSEFSRNISNPALRDKTRAKLEDAFNRAQMFRSVALPHLNGATSEAIGKSESNIAAEPSMPTKVFTKMIQPPSPSAPNGDFFNISKNDPNAKTATKDSNNLPKTNSSLEQAHPGGPMSNSSKATRKSTLTGPSSITLARAYLPQASGQTQMYGLPGLDICSPPPGAALGSNRLNPFDNNCSDGSYDDDDNFHNNDGVNDFLKRDFTSSDFKADQVRAHFQASPVKANTGGDYPDETLPKPSVKNTFSWTGRRKSSSVSSRESPVKNLMFGQSVIPTRESQSKGISIDRPVTPQRKSPSKGRLFGQSVTVGVMRKLGMGKKATTPTPPQGQQTARPGSRTQDKIPQGSGTDKTLGGTPSNIQKASDVQSGTSGSTRSHGSAPRIVNGVRVTGSSRAISGTGSSQDTEAGPERHGGQPFADRSERRENLECSCSFYHSHVFPGEPVNRDVLARLERREDAIMLSLRQEEEHMLNRDVAEEPHNIFWTPSLTFHPYRHGDELVEFPSLWPSYRELREHLQNSGIQNTVLRGDSVLDLCVLACTCGPAHLLQCLIELQLIREFC
ncbi:ankyrin-2 [Plakobranchus ocellatus]|uniref:Ankyrin-2 n=1 Tax=Plakobranchus ocellatus TaxID=259542 RepID=A0AAV3ZBE9_9GAST|nr:ankyrin-2 [Plakobranchus ocellatus]